jgi:uncharacterized protein (TIGR04255 family)
MKVVKEKMHIDKPPIVLSIVQFRYEKLENFNSKKIKELGEEIKKDFPVVSEAIVQNIRIDNTSETKFTLDSREINGVRFENNEKTAALIIDGSKFTFESNLPYTNWLELSKIVRRMWELFSPSLDGLMLTGLSMRFLNRINLPIDFTDPSKYFTTFIQSSSGTHGINTYQLKYTSTFNDCISHIGHSIEPAIGDKITYFFDIDVIKIKRINNQPEEIWPIFEELKTLKNNIFFDGITEETLKLLS